MKNGNPQVAVFHCPVQHVAICHDAPPRITGWLAVRKAARNTSFIRPEPLSDLKHGDYSFPMSNLA